MKYVLMTTSANLGNMLSMALATFIIPFLPLTAGQILLNNFLSDIPTIGLARDAVDPELVTNPRRWDAKFIQNFMLSFGLLSTVFDILTFWLLLGAFHLNAEEFRTGWFVESLLTELCMLFVLRTQRPFYRSRPNFFLIISSIVIAALAFIIPYAPFARSLGFVPLPGRVLICIIALTIAYTLATEVAKSTFFSWSRNKT
jgi:Mg2+-importing ATPase